MPLIIFCLPSWGVIFSLLKHTIWNTINLLRCCVDLMHLRGAKRLVTFWALLKCMRRFTANSAANSADKCSDAKEEEEEIESAATVDVEDTVTVLLFALGTPRFLFVCGNNGGVLRTADRCGTFRRLALSAKEQPPVEMSLKPVDDDDAKLNEILSSLPSGEEHPSQAGHPPTKSDSKELDLFAIDAMKDRVVVAGARAFVAVSYQRGSEFRTVSHPLLDELGRNSTSDPSLPHTKDGLAIRFVRFYSESLV